MSARAKMVSGLVLLVVLAVGMNRTANVAAADRLAAACIRLRAARSTWWTRNESIFGRLLEDDLPFVHDLFDELGEEACTEVGDRLRAPFAVGVVQTWQGEPWPEARMAHLREVSARAETRCVPLMRALLAEPEGLSQAEIDAAADDACGDMTASLTRFGATDREASEPVTLLEWPEQIEAMTRALESVVGP